MRGDAKTFAGVKDEDEAWWTVGSLLNDERIESMTRDERIARAHEFAVKVVERGDWDDILSS